MTIENLITQWLLFTTVGSEKHEYYDELKDELLNLGYDVEDLRVTHYRDEATIHLMKDGEPVNITVEFRVTKQDE